MKRYFHYEKAKVAQTKKTGRKWEWYCRQCKWAGHEFEHYTAFQKALHHMLMEHGMRY